VRFSRAFLALTYLVASLGFISLLLAGDVGVLGMAAIALGMLGSRGALRRFSPSDSTWRVLTVVFLLYAGLQYFALGASPLDVARDLLIYLQINRLFMRRHNRDYGHIYLLAFLQMLLGCILTINPLFALILVGFMVASAWALLLLQLKVGMDEQHELDKTGAAPGGTDAAPGGTDAAIEARYTAASPLLSLPFLAGSAAVTLAMLVTTIGLFLLTPRMEISLFHNRSANAVHVAGFSEEVALGEVGRILTRKDRVMRVRIEAPTGVVPPTPYWRGLALDLFDGRTWRLSLARTELVHTRPVSLNSDRLPRGTNAVQHYTLEPIDARVLFVLPSVLEIESSQNTVLRNFTGSYQTGDKQGRMDYTIFSRIDEPAPDALKADRSVMPERLARIYLQLPELPPRVRALAERVTAGAPDNYEKVRALEAYLRANYTYTLEPQSGGETPLEDFLFRTRAGHCEYFASALVVLTRSVGIPARMVNGFLGGELNPVGGYYIVRQKDAHSWVEVWFGRQGWVRFDPTPPGAAAGAQDAQPSLASRIGYYLDFLEMQWYHYVLDYDLRAQLELFSNLLSGVSPGGGVSRFERPESTLNRRGLAKWLLVLSGASGIISGALWWYRRRSMAPAEPQVLTTAQGRRFVKLRKALHRELDRRGFARRAGETPLERAERAGRALGGDGTLIRIEHTWYAARYGQVPLREPELQRIDAALRFVRRLPATPPSRGGGERSAAG
jgi:transglutaminase-like putative cysteine protease